tara:strand:+ start:1729 stop:2589 length:861 start_codon:yes stop_codon:yes gene_type:complete
MIDWSKIPVKERKLKYKEISKGKSLPLKTLMFKNIYRGQECVLLNCGPSLSEFPIEKIREFCADKPVFSVKSATLKFQDIADICITNFYGTFQFPSPDDRNYLVFARQETPLGYANWVNPDLVEESTFGESFDNEPDILWGSDISVRHSKSVVMTQRWEENSLDKSPYNRMLGPGIMNDMIVPILVHTGVNKVSILGWDGANIDEKGYIKHFYDLEPQYMPNLNYVSEKFDVNNLKSDMEQCEQQIGKLGELQILEYFKQKNMTIEILTKNSSVHTQIPRNNILYR